MLKVSHTYISKIENEKLDFGDYPSEELIRKIAKALAADVDELLMLAEKIPEQIKNRCFGTPGRLPQDRPTRRQDPQQIAEGLDDE